MTSREEREYSDDDIDEQIEGQADHYVIEESREECLEWDSPKSGMNSSVGH